jgi:ankyrin repeat protein
VKYLLEHHGIAFEPDYKGYYPFDYAGRNNHKEVVELLIRNLAEILFDYQLFQAHQLRCGNNVDKHIFYQDLANFHDRMLQNPLLKVKMLFWVCYFSLDLNLLK